MGARRLSFRLLLVLAGAVFVLLAVACGTSQPLTLTLDCNDEEFVQEVMDLSETQKVQILEMYPGSEELARSKNMLMCVGVVRISTRDTDEYIYYRYAIDRDGNDHINYIGHGFELPTPQPSPTPYMLFEPKSDILGFPAGAWSHMRPGLYSAPGGEFCYWARVSEWTVPEGIIASGFGDYRHVVEIHATDLGFRSVGCGWWSVINDVLVLRPTIPDGMWHVGHEITTFGTYTAPGGEFCYWEKLSGFGGEPEDVIASGSGDTKQTVELFLADEGFHTSGCGEWIPEN